MDLLIGCEYLSLSLLRALSLSLKESPIGSQLDGGVLGVFFVYLFKVILAPLFFGIYVFFCTSLHSHSRTTARAAVL